MEIEAEAETAIERCLGRIFAQKRHVTHDCHVSKGALSRE